MYLISETTKEEREAIVKESLGNIEASCDGCMAGLAEMDIRNILDGTKESAILTWSLTESSKSPVSIAKSNKQWVGTCLYQEECKLLLINCEAVIWL